MPMSFEVGAAFRVVDEASPVLRRISELFEKIDVQMKKIGAMRFAGATEGLSAINEQLSLISKDRG